MDYKRLFFTALFALVLYASAFAQPAREPIQQKLLNGLKVLTWSNPTAPNVAIKLRVHSGSAFDPKDKMGVMALLADILFPTEQSREFFRDDLEGSLEVISDYDFIQINATGKSEEFLTMIETIATAISTPPITQENFVRVRNERAKLIAELNANSSYVADRAVAKHLLGDFPYGRAQEGTLASLKLIDRTDLITARDRFLTSDNATLAIIGNVKPDFAHRAARRLFGVWKKSDKLAPSSFRIPDAPKTDTLQIEMENIPGAEIRAATRGFARSESDFAAAQLLTAILQEKYPALLSPEFRSGAKISNKSFYLPGIFQVSLSSTSNDVSKCGAEIHKFMKLRGMVSNADLETARNRAANAISSALADANSASTFWLDADTYKLAPVKDRLKTVNAVTLADVLRVYDRIVNETAPRAFVMIVPKQSATTSTVNQ